MRSRQSLSGRWVHEKEERELFIKSTLLSLSVILTDQVWSLKLGKS